MRAHHIATIDFICPGCESKTKVAFPKPKILEPTTTQAECGACESRWFVKANRVAEKGRVNIETRVIKLSPKLLKMKHDEAEFNKLSLEDQEKTAEPSGNSHAKNNEAPQEASV